MNPNPDQNREANALEETLSQHTDFSENKTHSPSSPAVAGDESVTEDEDFVLEQALESFAPHAPLDNPGDLVRYIQGHDKTVSQFVLNELIKLDMAAHAEAGNRPEIELYTKAFPTLLPPDNIPVDLVMEEIQLRKEHGEQPKLEAYEQRFPQFKSILAPLLGAAEATASPQSRGAPPPIEIGSTVDDFLIIQTLGTGAFAFVYLARQVSMHRLVALKVSKGTGDEPQALSQFDHPNIVRVYDQRFMSDPQVHLLYMQYLPGGTLAEVVKLVRGYGADQRNGNLLLDAVDRQLLSAAQAVPERSTVRRWLSDEASDWATVVAWLGAQLARALEAAHHRGVYHRDVKPANVLLTPEGIPKLADFNVSFAGAAGRAGAAATFGGSIGYMSPEHLDALNPNHLANPEEVTERADLYSLAILLWELWQGNRPFDCPSQHTSWTDAIQAQTNSRHEPLLVPQRSGDATERVLETTLRETLSPLPDDRPASGAALAGRLKLALYPDAAKIFRPAGNALWEALTSSGRWTPWVVAALVIMLPNLAMTPVNYIFNMLSMEEVARSAVLEELGKGPLEFHTLDESQRSRVVQIKDELAEFLHQFSRRVDLIVLPLGLLLALYRIRPAARAIYLAQQGHPPTDRGLSAVLYLSQHAALLGAVLWGITGTVYSIVLWWKFEIFHISDAIQFFMTLVICGGIAATYPFFGMALLATMIYYPRMVRESMEDAHFDRRHKTMLRRAEFWLWAGFGVPLLGVGLLITRVQRHQGAQEFLSALVILTFLGFVAAFLAYTRILQVRWAAMEKVLSPNATSTIPGIDG